MLAVQFECILCNQIIQAFSFWDIETFPNVGIWDIQTAVVGDSPNSSNLNDRGHRLNTHTMTSLGDSWHMYKLLCRKGRFVLCSLRKTEWCQKKVNGWNNTSNKQCVGDNSWSCDEVLCVCSCYMPRWLYGIAYALLSFMADWCPTSMV